MPFLVRAQSPYSGAIPRGPLLNPDNALRTVRVTPARYRGELGGRIRSDLAPFLRRERCRALGASCGRAVPACGDPTINTAPLLRAIRYVPVWVTPARLCNCAADDPAADHPDVRAARSRFLLRERNGRSLRAGRICRPRGTWPCSNLVAPQPRGRQSLGCALRALQGPGTSAGAAGGLDPGARSGAHSSPG